MASTRRQITAAAVASAAVAAVAIVGSGSIRPAFWRQPQERRRCPERMDVSSVRRDADADADADRDRGGPIISGRNGAVNLDACHLFSGSYEEARNRFRDAARQLPGARLVALPLPVDDDDAAAADLGGGNDNDDATAYTIDLAVIPGTTLAGGGGAAAPRLVVHTSGVHGVEGYAGSAVQIAFLQLLLKDHQSWGGFGSTTGDESDGARPTVVLVHAFNPFGMAHFRRVNENNVDLNRNGIRDFASLVASEGDDGDDHEAARDRKGAYETFRNLFVPAVSPSTPFGWLWLRQWLVFAWEASRNGVPLLKEAMVVGQYHDPAGIFYGGDRIQGSYTVLERWITEELLPSVLASRNESSAAERANQPALDVTWIDVHTGLGPSGEDTILPCLPKAHSPDATKLSRLREKFPHSHHPSSSAAGSQVASGYGKVRGQVGDYFEGTFRPVSSQTTFVVQEFGTIAAPRVGHALIVENAWRQRQRREAGGRGNEASQWLRHAFYPDDALWRKNVVTRGLRVLLQGMLP